MSDKVPAPLLLCACGNTGLVCANAETRCKYLGAGRTSGKRRGKWRKGKA